MAMVNGILKWTRPAARILHPTPPRVPGRFAISAATLTPTVPSPRMGAPDLSPLGPFGPAGDYIRRLDDVPGWFLHVDARLLMGVDALQRERDVTWDVLEIGAYMG